MEKSVDEKIDIPVIVILGAVRFDGIYESTSFNTAKSLARYTKVYYIENPYTFKDLYKERHQDHLKRRWKFFLQKRKTIKTDNPLLQVVVVPPLLSIHFLPESSLYRFFLKHNERRIARCIRRILKVDGIDNYIFINSFNFHYPDVGKRLSSQLNIYQCVDPLIMDFDKKHGLRSEMELLQSSDVVVCTSRALYKEKAAINPHTYFVPNAADISHSSKALNSDLPILPVLDQFKNPIVGYLGNIERRLDFHLLQQVVSKNLQYDFVFAGPISMEFVPDWVFQQPNLHLIGRVAYADLPRLLKGFDVCLIPFKKDAVSVTIFPLKLFEYLGSGKPVIATDFNPDLKEFTRDSVTYTSNAEEFSRVIADAMLHNGEGGDIEKRLAIAQENTWEARAKTWLGIISTSLSRKACLSANPKLLLPK